MTKNQKNVFILLACLLSYHYFSYFILETIGSWYFHYVLRPIICLGLTILIMKRKKRKSQISLKHQPYFIMLCTIAGVSYMVTYLLLGTIEGFGRNPFDVSLKGILYNLLSFYPYYLFLELLRAHMINGVRKPQRKWTMIAIIAVYSLLDFSTRAWTELFQNDLQKNIVFLGSEFLPSITNQFMLTQVALMGGWIPAFILKLSYESMYYFFAVLPDLEWIAKAFVNTLFPIFTVFVIVDYSDKKGGRLPKRVQNKDMNPLMTMATYVVSIAIIWFSMGVFQVFPTLILTGSMEPMINPGDVVIMKRVDPSEIGVGDIIQFRVEEYDIIHRVVSIEGKEFKTKGDNNNVTDRNLVNPRSVRGKYLFHLPAIGRLNLFLKSNLRRSLLERIEQEFELGSDDTK